MTYPTTADVKTWLGISGATEDTVIGWTVAAAQSWVEKRTGRVFVAANATRAFPVRFPYVSEKNRLRLSLMEDLTSITTITNGDGVAVAVGEYDLHPTKPPYYQIHLRPLSAKTWVTYDDTPISIVGAWGYSAACPAAIFDAIIQIAALLYRARQSSGQTTMVSPAGLQMQGMMIPPYVALAVDSYRRYTG